MAAAVTNIEIRHQQQQLAHGSFSLLLSAEQAKRRPDYQRLVTELRQAELEVRSSSAEYLPTLGAFASIRIFYNKSGVSGNRIYLSRKSPRGKTVPA